MNIKHVISEISEALEAASDYFDKRADVVDGPYGIPEADEDMRLLQRCEAAIKLLSALQSRMEKADA
jgi:hypothetical protein